MASPLKEGTDAQMEMYKFYCCKGSVCNNYQSHCSHLCSPAGKDLSKVSMPVTLNEPLSALQRLCEELQYSELLDEAAALSDVHDRMVWNLG